MLRKQSRSTTAIRCLLTLLTSSTKSFHMRNIRFFWFDKICPYLRLQSWIKNNIWGPNTISECLTWWKMNIQSKSSVCESVLIKQFQHNDAKVSSVHWWEERGKWLVSLDILCAMCIFKTELWNTHEHVRNQRQSFTITTRLIIFAINHYHFLREFCTFIATPLVSNHLLRDSQKLEKLLAQAHATDQHCKQFILTAFWCGGTDTKCGQFLIRNRPFKSHSLLPTAVAPLRQPILVFWDRFPVQPRLSWSSLGIPGWPQT